MKKIIILALCLSVLAFCLVGCSDNTQTNTDSGTDLSNTTIAGQVTAIDGTSVTLQLGDLTGNNKSAAPADDATKDEATSSDTTGSASTDTATSGTAPSGEAPGGAVPSGEAPSGAAPSGEAPSGAAPSGEAPSGAAPSGEAPSGGGPRSTFTAGSENIAITIGDDATITIEGMGENTTGTIDDIKVGDILEVTFGDNNTVTAVIVKNVMVNVDNTNGTDQTTNNNSTTSTDDTSDSTDDNAVDTIDKNAADSTD